MCQVSNIVKLNANSSLLRADTLIYVGLQALETILYTNVSMAN